MYLLLRIREQLSNILFTSSDIYTENFGSVNYLRFFSVEHLANLSRHEGLARPRWSVEKQPLNVLNAELFYETKRKYTRCKGSSEDSSEFRVQTTNTHVFELEVRCENRIGRSLFR